MEETKNQKPVILMVGQTDRMVLELALEKGKELVPMLSQMIHYLGFFQAVVEAHPVRFQSMIQTLDLAEKEEAGILDIGIAMTPVIIILKMV